MKTRMIIAACTLFMLATATMASTKSTADLAVSSDAAKYLETKISYPVVARSYNITGSVYFKLTVDENQMLTYELIASESQVLAESVEKQLQKLKTEIASKIEPGSTQVFRLRFNTL